MASQKGRVITCDRCGTAVFTKLHHDTYMGGGTTTREPGEANAPGWHYGTVAGIFRDLCPACAAEWRKIGTAFINRVPVLIAAGQTKNEEATQ